ncbi:hypothetical protein CF106_00265 [Aeromonas veronii]|nr:hypothetical protein CF106_00265 [Aeromonas veronii]
MAHMNNGNFAIALTVGINDQLTNPARKLELVIERLERELEQLQRTAGDTQGLARLERETNQLENEMRHTSRATSRYAQEIGQADDELKRMARSTDHAAKEQKGLQNELKESISMLGQIKDMTVKVTALYGAGRLMGEGLDLSAQERRQGVIMGRRDYFSSEEQRKWRLELTKQTGADGASIVNMQAEAMRLGLNDKDAMSATEGAIKLNKLNPNFDPQDAITAINGMVVGLGAKADEAADMVYQIWRQSGDKQNDLLDTIKEYAQVMQGSGLTMQQFGSMMIGGAQGGAYSYDKVMDGLKELFKARLSDPDERKKLLGDGKTPGLIDQQVRDKGMRQELKSELHAYRLAYEKGESVAEPIANLLESVQTLYKKDRDAAKAILEGIGGTLWSEDLGEGSLTGMLKGLRESDTLTKGYQGALSKDSSLALTPSGQALNHALAAKELAAVQVANAEQQAAPYVPTLLQNANELGQAASDNPIATGATAAAGAGVAGGAYYYGKRKVIQIGAKLLEQGVEQADNARLAPLAQGVPKYLAKTVKGAPLLMGGVDTVTALAQGDMQGAAVEASGMAGAWAGASGGAAVGSLAGPWGTALGGIAGAIFGEAAVEALVKSAMDLLNEGDGGKLDAEMTRLLPQEQTPARPSTNVLPPAMPIQLTITNDFHFEGQLIGDSAELERKMIEVFRQSTPEMVQELKDSLERVMQSMDYAQPSN